MLLEAVWLQMDVLDSCRGCLSHWRLRGYRSRLGFISRLFMLLEAVWLQMEPMDSNRSCIYH